MTDSVKKVPVRYELSAREQKYALEGRMLPDTVFEMKEKVLPSLLREAVREAVRLHPLFGTVLIRNGLFWLEETGDWEQEREGVVIAGGGKGACLWMIRCQENEIVLSGSHTLTDWGGMMRFAASLLHLYFEKNGVCFSVASGTDLPGSPEETTFAPRRKYAEFPCSPLGVPRFPSAAQLSEADFDTRMGGGMFRLEFSSDEVHRFASRSETSVFSVIACLLARSIQNTFSMNDGSVVIRVPVDYRRTFSSITDHNFSQGFSLCYRPEKMRNLPDASVETAFRSQLDLYVDRDQMIHTLQCDRERMMRLEKDPDSLEGLNAHREGADGPTATIVYSHITKPCFSEELSSRISRIYAHPHSDVPYTMLAYSITFAGVITTTVLQHVTDDRFITALKQVLDERKIRYQLTEMTEEQEKKNR